MVLVGPCPFLLSLVVTTFTPINLWVESQPYGMVIAVCHHYKHLVLIWDMLIQSTVLIRIWNYHLSTFCSVSGQGQWMAFLRHGWLGNSASPHILKLPKWRITNGIANGIRRFTDSCFLFSILTLLQMSPHTSSECNQQCLKLTNENSVLILCY